MKAFVTGGSGFVGQRVIARLVGRGYEVTALARSTEAAAAVSRLGARPAAGDIADVSAMREAMRGSQVVYHLAGWYRIGAADPMEGETINVGGTRKVLRLAHELGVPRIVYVSTVAVFGDTRGRLVNEEHFDAGPFLTEYDRTKWLAHYKVAVPLMRKGAPIIIAMPGVIYGPGDHSMVADLMREFYKGRLPILPGPETTFTWAHVEDIAEGIILAAEKGRVGESYVLAGPAIPLGEMFDFWSQLTGRPRPVMHIPARWARPLGPLVGALAALLPLPPLYNAETFQILGATYAARADKARAELGWFPRPLHGGMLETFAALAAEAGQRPAPPDRERKLAGAALLAAAALLLLYLTRRRR